MAEHTDRDRTGEGKPRRKRFFLEFLGWAAAIFAIVFLAPLFIYKWKSYMGGAGSLGEFGDQFGAVNALFSGLAFAGVIVAMRMQSRELQLQQRELADTRAVMTDQKDQLALQAASMQKQTFENTFFQMMNLYNQTVQGIVASVSDWDTNGKSAIWHYRYRYEEGFKKNLANELEGSRAIPNWSEVTRSAKHNQYYRLWHREHANQFGHYFRYILKIAEFIDRQSVEASKGFYIGLLCSQLSESELFLIFYHTVSDQSHEAALPLYVKQDFFYSLKPHNLIFERDRELLRFTLAQRQARESGG